MLALLALTLVLAGAPQDAAPPIIDADFSPDGRYVLAQTTAEIVVWEAKSGKRLGAIPSGIWSFSSDSGLLLTHNLVGWMAQKAESAGEPAALEIWRLPTLEKVWTVSTERTGVSLAFSSRAKFIDGGRVALGEGRRVILLDVQTQTKRAGVPVERRESADAVFCNGNFVVAHGRHVEVWSLAENKQLFSFEARENVYHMELLGERCLRVTVWNVQKYGSVATIDPLNKVEVWDLVEKRRLDLPETTHSAILSTNGTNLLAGTLEGEILALRFPSGDRVSVFRAAAKGSAVVACSADGRHALSYDSTGDTARLHLWDTRAGLKNESFHEFQVRAVRGWRAALLSDGGARIINLTENRIESDVKAPGLAQVSLASDPPLGFRRLSHRIEVVDLRTGAQLSAFDLTSK